MTEPKTVPAFKCVRANGRDFRTNTIDYIAAIAEGRAVECLDAAPPTGQVCGHGLHVSPTARQTIQFADRAYSPWRWLEGTVLEQDVVEQDASKMRVRRFTPTKEITVHDIFGPDFGRRIEAVREEARSWKAIPWLKPATEAAVVEIVGRWREAITPWLRKNGYQLPQAVRIVRERSVGADAAAAGAADDAAVVVGGGGVPYWLRWYVRPRYVLWRAARWKIAGMEQPSPWEPLVELYRLGAMPIGYSGGAFVVYIPKIKE